MMTRLQRACRQRLANLDRRDLWLAIAVAVVGAVGSLALSGQLPRELYESDSLDVWFESDVPRMYENLTSRRTYSRSTHHPVFHLGAVLLGTLLVKIAGIDPVTALRGLLALTCGLWTAGVFALLRAVGCRRGDAVLFTGVGLSSASAVFFFALPDTFLVGSLTIILALLWAAIDEPGQRSQIVEAFVSAGTMGVSLTNWMAGVLASFWRRPLKQTLRICFGALAIVVLLWALQKTIVPNAEFFLAAHHTQQQGQMFSPDAGGFSGVLVSFFAHTMVMPEITVVDRATAGTWWPSLLTQKSPAASAGAWGPVALIAWLVLLVLGVAALATLGRRPRIRLLLASVILGQFALHFVYGNETFLYSLHWLPLLLAVIALSSLTKARLVALGAAGVFLLTAGFNNFLQFRESARFLAGRLPAVRHRKDVESLSAKQAYLRPGEANIIPNCISPPDGAVAGPAVDRLFSPWFEQAAYEGGGGLWPARQAFNVGIWVYSDSGELITTSHSLKPVELRSGPNVEGKPQISFATSHYRGRWECSEPRRWRLELEVPSAKAPQMDLVFRGIGWDHSRIFSAKTGRDGLVLNERWRITMDPGMETVRLGEEGRPDWINGAAKPIAELHDVAGLVFARIGPLAPGSHKVTIIDDLAGQSVDVSRGKLSYALKGFQPVARRSAPGDANPQ
jgi:hypothetical protein